MPSFRWQKYNKVLVYPIFLAQKTIIQALILMFQLPLQNFQQISLAFKKVATKAQKRGQKVVWLYNFL
jgi:hypothetical protein